MRGFTRQVQKSIGQCAAQAKERGRTTQDAEKTAAGTKREERSALPPRGLGWRDSSRPSAGRQRGKVAGWAARLTLKQFFALPRNPLARRRIFSLRILSSTRAPTTTFRPSLWASGRFWMRIANFREHHRNRDGRSCRRARGLLARRRCPVRLGSGWGVGLPQGGHASPGQEGAVQSGAPPLPPGRPGDPQLTPSSISLRQPPLARSPSL